MDSPHVENRFCKLAGVDAADTAAVAVGLPDIDSQDAWPLITGQSVAPLRQQMMLSGSTMIDAAGWKIILSKCHQG